MEDQVQYLFVFLSGLLAGYINTFAGNGSAITLATLIDVVGLGPLAANATNRIGILGHGLISTPTYVRHHGLVKDRLRFIWPPLFAGAALGAYWSRYGSPEHFIWVYRVMMVCLLFVIWARPKRWIERTSPSDLPRPASMLLYFVLGVYGGYIQMGMGIFFLAGLVILEGYAMRQANGIKLATVLMYTIPLVLFLLPSGWINWRWGITLLVGQIIGGYLSAHFISRWRHADRMAYYLLLAIVICALLNQAWTIFR